MRPTLEVEWHGLMVETLLETASRVSAFASLDASDVDFSEVEIRFRSNKGRKSRGVPAEAAVFGGHGHDSGRFSCVVHLELTVDSARPRRGCHLLSDGSKIFVSYTQSDRAWAEWIAWQLEEEGYATILQAWHFGASSNFVHKMHQAVQDADCTIAVLSPEYERSDFGFAEWGAAFAEDPTGEERKLATVRVEPYKPSGLLGTRVYIDLVDLAEKPARERLLTEIRGPKKPDTAPTYPARKTRSERFPGSRPARWNVPHRRNRFFTGRANVLERLHEALNEGGAAALGQAISGLGGIGKTQTAVEYAYRYRDQYSAVLWTQAATEAELIAGMVEVARVLELPEAAAPEQALAVQAARRWLETETSWLWILDNADTPEIVEPFLPLERSGHILLTSRAQNFARLEIDPFKLPTFPSEEARSFLLERTRRAAPPTAESKALDELAEELGYLPLALEQAAAYLSEHDARFVDYLAEYRRRHLKLLAQGSVREDREPVATTWSLNFDQVAQASEASADILRLSAFLNPDEIPFELLIRGAGELGPNLSEALEKASQNPLLLNELLEPLTRYSLIEPDRDEQTYSVHRMVQTVVESALGKKLRNLWLERSVSALALAYPGSQVEAWPLCDRLVPHWRLAATAIEQWQLESEAAGRLLNQAGFYAQARGNYREAGPLYERSLQIWEKVLGEEHPDVARSLNNIASLHKDQGDYERATPLLERSLQIWEKVLGEEHPDVARSLNNIAMLHQDQGDYERATPLLERSLQIREKVLGEEHPDVARSLNNIAMLHHAQGDYERATPLYERSLQIWEKVLGEEHPDVATSLNNIAMLHHAQGDYERATPLLERSLQIREKVLGEEHPDVARSLNNIAMLHHAQGDYERATPLYERSLQIWEKVLGEEHPDVATSLNNIAMLHHAQGDYERATPLLERSLQIREKVLGEEHPDVATSLNNIAMLHHAQGDYERATPLLERSLQIREKVLGEEHPDVARSLNNIAMLHHAQGDYERATPLYERSLQIWEKVLGEEHPDVATSLNNIAMLHHAQGDYERATPLLERSLQIREKVLGEEHPDVASSLNNIAMLHKAQGDYERATPLYERSLQIWEKVLGEEHPDVATCLENYAALCRASSHPNKAAELETRAKAIRAKLGSK